MTRFTFPFAILASLATTSLAAHADVRYRLTQIAPDAPTSGILAADLNDRGQVVGSIQEVNGRTHAFAWRGGTLTDLGPIVAPTSPESRATGNNNRGDIVGFFFDTQINDHGAIVASGRDSRFPSELRTYLLTPVH